jgi:hypothetical protein
VIIPFARRALPSALAVAAAIVGAFVAWRYHQLGLTLTHYDARGHLVVARRIFDSITPGWQQIGAVWLPLPHLLNAIPVQIDFFYRTGLSAVAISIAAFAIAVGAIAWIVLALTDSRAAALAGAAVFALNPNVLYLQATPMTEPLLLALTTLAIAMLMAFADARLKPRAPMTAADGARGFSRATGIANDGARGFSRAIGLVFALACLTRYEAWPVTAIALALAAWALWRNGRPWRDAVRDVGSIAVYPALAIVAFTIYSRAVVGQWFVGDDFFVPENKAIGDVSMALKEIGWGTETLSATLLVWIAAAGAAILVVRALVRRRDAAAMLPLALAAAAAIPWVAFLKGHPFRIRYMVPLIAVEAIGAGVVAGAIRRVQVAAAIVVIVIAGYELHPLDASAPMVVEAQWDRPNRPVRARVTDCLGGPRPGETIMASMGSLGHYMQETSHEGFALHDFLHEGNGDIWLAAISHGPRPFAEWVLIEEKAQGGDMLAQIARARPSFLDGYTRVCDGAGLALYKREDQNLKPTMNK